MLQTLKSSSILSVVVCFLVSSCGKTDPKKIGFLTDNNSWNLDIDQSGLEGFLLAVENHNRSFPAQPVEAVVSNPQDGANTVKTIVENFAKQDVQGLVGPMTSNLASAALPSLEKFRLPTISPTVSSWHFDQKKDLLFRVYPSNKLHASKLAKQLTKTFGIKTFGIIKDSDNAAHSDAFAQAFSKVCTQNGSVVLFTVAYSHQSRPSFSEMVGNFSQWPEAILILANSSDTAVIAQQIRKLDQTTLLCSSEWSVSNSVFELGGSAISGIVTTSAMNPDNRTESYLAFATAYQKRFNRKPDSASVMAYDATQTMIQALWNGIEPIKYLSERRSYQGLQGPFAIDEYGDPQRTIHLIVLDSDGVKKIDTH